MNTPIAPTADAAQTLCGVAATTPAHRAARWLLPLGALAALLPWTPPWAALLAGTALALSLGNPCARLTANLSKPLLQLAVVGLGAGMNLAIVGRVGLRGLGYTIVGLLATAALGTLLARWLQLRPRVAALITAGTGICGGSAIAAVAPAICATAAETSAALATVFLLNGVALLVFPPLGTLAGLDPHAFGLWCALAIHDTSSVTGAALTHGAEALATATTVKLARALWILPVALALGWWFAPRCCAGAECKPRGAKFPLFIAGFVALSALFTFVPALAPAAPWITRAARAALTLTLFLIGTGLDRASVRAVGARPFVHGLLLWLLAAGGTLVSIKLGWIT
ncbi:MAG TPA: putative sulfate exporter family transporter [Opitutaceae bacterium]|nr:putative sulfate exporter family transporter [Opitutaceae bacterium]